MQRSQFVNPLDYECWDEWLLNTPGCSFFHTSSWVDVLSRAYNYKPVYFTEFGEQKLSAILPLVEVKSFLTGNRGVSLPFTDYCEPIVSEKAQFPEVFKAAVAFGKKQKWRYLEFRGGDSFFQGERPYAWHYGHTLDLTQGSGRIYDGLRDSNRRNIKKSEKNKIEISVLATPAALKEFCRLNIMTRREHGLPPQPDRFFQHLYDNIISKDRGFIVMASWQGTVVAANVYFNFGDELIYKYGASDRAFQHLRANNLVMWETIKWGCDHGYRTLCLGRTEPDNEGLRQFKAGWGVQERIIRYYRYDLREDAFVEAPDIVKPFHKKMFSKLPIPILNFLGNILYRHMG